MPEPDSNSTVKEFLKEKEITEDEDKIAHERIQKLTDSYIVKIDEVVAEKETEIMTV